MDAGKLIKLLKEKFKTRLERKTGWGKNEAYAEFLEALDEAIMETGLGG